MLSRRMLSKNDESATGNSDIEVSREDQNQINRFSKLHQREKVIEDELKTKAKDKEDLEEITMELELADEEDSVPYKIGDTFFDLPVPKIRSMLESSAAEIEKEVDGLGEQLHEVKEEMQGLKGKLYARFGRSINLET